MPTSDTSESTPMTALDAVNIMLGQITNVKVHSLLAGETNADAETALQMLTDTSREVQSEGWHWNKDLKRLLSVNQDGEIALPSNTLKVDTVYLSRCEDYAFRASKLYDRVNHTFNVEAEGVTEVYVDITVALPYDNLPQSAKWYIAVKAARRFATQKLVDETAWRFSREDEEMALSMLQSDDVETSDETMANVNPHIWFMRRK